MRVVLQALRGATQVDRDEADHVLERTRELLRAVVGGNDLAPDDLVSIVFSATPDVCSVAPAVAARQLGLNGVALLCVQEMPVTGSMPRVVRLLAHVRRDAEGDVENVYLHGTRTLREEIPPLPAGEASLA